MKFFTHLDWGGIFIDLNEDYADDIRQGKYFNIDKNEIVLCWKNLLKEIAFEEAFPKYIVELSQEIENLKRENYSLSEKNRNIEQAYFKLQQAHDEREAEMEKIYFKQKEKIDSLEEQLAEYIGNSPKENKELRDKIKILEKKLSIAEKLYFKSVYESWELE
jgi:hypothetical protein